MRQVILQAGADLDGFRKAVRRLIKEQIPPDRVTFTDESASLFGGSVAGEAPPFGLPRAAGDLIQTVVCHSDPERYGLLYALVWRILQGERALMQVQSDPLVHRLAMMAKSVRRDLHKMHAFVRFRRLERADGEEHFVAWFEPDHYIVDATARFFVDRFTSMDWTILTPKGSLHWDRRTLHRGPSARRGDAPDSDEFEAGWITYYESVFNPARVNPAVMRGEMAKKYWRNLPEAAAIPQMIRDAPRRVQEMIEREAAMPVKRNPDKAVERMSTQEPQSLDALNLIIKAAEPMVPGASQAVLGEGPIHPKIAFVGEQPGDEEDREGRPFVGPAGRLLNQAMAEAGIDRSRAYVTNAVKHFKFQMRGKRRLHQTPTAGEVKHYRWWLMKELELVQPEIVVALGATAVLALEGKPLPVMKNRGPHAFGDQPGFITVHPSYLLRVQGEPEKAAAYRQFVADLKSIEARAEAA